MRDDKYERAKLRKQAYNRERLRLKRVQYQLEWDELQSQLASLLEQAESLSERIHPRPLTWREVAMSLKECRELSERQQRALTQQVESHRRLSRALQQWLCHSIPRMPVSVTRNWDFASLPEDDEARILGIEWINKRLTNSVEQLKSQRRQEKFFLTIDGVGETYSMKELKHCVEPFSLRNVVDCLHKIYFETFPDDLVERKEDAPHWQYVRYPSLHGQAIQNNYFEKMLVMEAQLSESQYVVFTHSLADDAKYQDSIKSHWTAWVIAEAISESSTCLSFGFESLGLCRANGEFLTLEEEFPQLAATQDDLLAAVRQQQENYRRQRDAQDRSALRKLLLQNM